MRCRRGQHYETEEFMQMVSPTRTGSRPPLRGPMHAFWKAGLVALGLTVIGTTGCSKSRSRDQDDDDDDDDPAPAQQAAAVACSLSGPSVDAHWTDTNAAAPTTAPTLRIVTDL